MIIKEVKDLETMVAFIENANVEDLSSDVWSDVDEMFFELLRKFKKNEIRNYFNNLIELDIFNDRFKVLNKLPKTINTIAFICFYR